MSIVEGQAGLGVGHLGQHGCWRWKGREAGEGGGGGVTSNPHLPAHFYINQSNLGTSRNKSAPIYPLTEH